MLPSNQAAETCMLAKIFEALLNMPPEFILPPGDDDETESTNALLQHEAGNAGMEPSSSGPEAAGEPGNQVA